MNRELLITKISNLVPFFEAVSLCLPYLPPELGSHLGTMLGYEISEMKDICNILSEKEMSNLPLGAEMDESAPYNINEKVFKFSVEITGDFFYEYFGTLDKDEFEIAELLKQRFADDLVLRGDIDITKLDVYVD